MEGPCTCEGRDAQISRGPVTTASRQRGGFLRAARIQLQERRAAATSGEGMPPGWPYLRDGVLRIRSDRGASVRAREAHRMQPWTTSRALGGKGSAMRHVCRWLLQLQHASLSVHGVFAWLLFKLGWSSSVRKLWCASCSVGTSLLALHDSTQFVSAHVDLETKPALQMI
jgi:hypothetical protein